MNLPDHTARDAEVARLEDQRLRRSRVRASSDFEQVTCLRLRGLGFVNVEKVATPTRLNRITGKQYRTAAVSGDIKAMDPATGRAVLCECKLYPGGLPFSELRSHQVTRLDECAKGKGLALLCLGAHGQIHLLEWSLLRTAGFGPGKSISPAMVTFATYRHNRTR